MGKRLLRSETLLFPLEGAAECDGIEVMGGGRRIAGKKENVERGKERAQLDYLRSQLRG